jgi:hypothetical protein
MFPLFEGKLSPQSGPESSQKPDNAPSPRLVDQLQLVVSHGQQIMDVLILPVQSLDHQLVPVQLMIDHLMLGVLLHLRYMLEGDLLQPQPIFPRIVILKFPVQILGKLAGGSYVHPPVTIFIVILQTAQMGIIKLVQLFQVLGADIT